MKIVLRKPRLLEQLEKDTLLKLAQGFELPVRSNISASTLFEALKSKNSIKTDAILSHLNVSELKSAH